MGMGRGPADPKKKKIINKIYKNKYSDKLINKFNNIYMVPLKKKYKWGTNNLYNYSAKNKIHPTYVQKILSEKRYNKKDYFEILKNLKNQDAKKFNPFKLIASTNIYSNKPLGTWRPSKYLKIKKF